MIYTESSVEYLVLTTLNMVWRKKLRGEGE